MMLKRKIVSNLSELKLHGMVDALKQQLGSDNYENKSFLQRLDELVTEQLNVTTNARVARLIKQSNIRWPAASIAVCGCARKKRSLRTRTTVVVAQGADSITSGSG